MTARITGTSGQDGSYLAELPISTGLEVHGLHDAVLARVRSRSCRARELPTWPADAV